MFEIDEGLVAPDPLPQLIARNDIARVRYQAEQDLERLAGQTDSKAIAEQFTAVGPELKRPKAQPNAFLRRASQRLLPPK